MSIRRLARATLRRLRRDVPPPPPDAGPVYRVVDGERDVIGCRVCAALRELLTFDWPTDPARMNRLMDEGGCYPAAPGVAFERIEHGDDVGLFRMVVPSDLTSMPALWFRTSDLMIEGSNIKPIVN